MLFKKELQKTIFNVLVKEPFYGLLLQELNIRLTEQIPTAGITYDKKQQKFLLYVNGNFFVERLQELEREGVMIHEVLHFLHKHIFSARYDIADVTDSETKMKLNLAMDMAINQYIQHLPESAVNVNQWKMEDGTPFPKLKPFEIYYDLIKQTTQKQEAPSNIGDGEGGGDKEGQSQQPPSGKSINRPMYEKYLPSEGQPTDVHDFDGLSDEEKKDSIKEMQKVIKRTIEKSSYGHSLVPDYIKDLLQELDTIIERINYKTLLMSFVKKSLPLFERTSTWNKPSRKFGYYAKGTKMGELPKVEFYIDSSGSISHTEINEFLSVMDSILKIGQKKCMLHKWHTAIYESSRYKNGTRLKESDLESGGTNVDPVMEKIEKSSADLSIILTDGFFDLPAIKPKNKNVLWVISKNGNTDESFLNNLIGKKIKIA